MKYFKTISCGTIAMLSLLVTSCSEIATQKEKRQDLPTISEISETSLVVLGTIQDAGSPQIACKKSCCSSLFENPDVNRKVVSLGVIDVSDNKTYLFEATPDIGSQIKKLTSLEQKGESEMVDAIFLTHAHIGHYTGLMFLGKEAMDAKNVPVYTMPRMQNFLEKNGPWSQLVKRKNIVLNTIKSDSAIQLSNQLKVTPFIVPHRDEFSETVGYKIQGPNKSALFIPDIDKWNKWNRNINQEIKKVNYAFLDATFYDSEELNSRDISQIPHPFIVESLEQFKDLTLTEKQKVIFIHFNHTNTIIDSTSIAYKLVTGQGFRVAQINDQFSL